MTENKTDDKATRVIHVQVKSLTQEELTRTCSRPVHWQKLTSVLMTYRSQIKMMMTVRYVTSTFYFVNEYRLSVYRYLLTQA